MAQAVAVAAARKCGVPDNDLAVARQSDEISQPLLELGA